MNDLPVGGMRGELSIDVKEWFDGLKGAQRSLASFAGEVSAQFKELEGKLRNVSIGLTAGITAPFAAMAVVTRRGAGSFEKSMNNVQAALNGISTAQLAELSKAAQALGPAVGRSAIEAGDAIETLALAGMDASSILDGGLAQTLKLAAANAADLGPAAELVTDVMAQFGKTAADLPPIVDKITGSLDSSKFGFVDFQQAISQAGGVAGSAGVTFEDFNTALAATSALFGSGSDAGTSFKTFITSLTPKSKEAEDVMAQLGLSFYEANGQMKSMADIAELLREKLGNLSERSRTEALTAIFGTDAMRTAIGLMQKGRQGFEDLQKTIADGNASEKLSVQLQGLEAATIRQTNAFESLKISLGATGLLAVFTGLTNALAGVAEGIANLNPTLLTIGVAIWGVAAAVGPLSLAILTMAKLAIPLAIGRLGLLGTSLAFMINPIGAAAGLLVKLAVTLTGASSAFTLFATRIGAFLGPIGLVITGLTLLYFWVNRTGTASAAATIAVNAANRAYAAQQTLATQLATATGKLREQLLAKANADRIAAVQAGRKAQADLAAARATLERSRVELAQRALRNGSGEFRGLNVDRKAKEPSVADAEADLKAKAEALQKYADTLTGLNESIAVAGARGGAVVDMTFGGEGSLGRSSAGGESPADLASRRDEIQLDQKMAVARARNDIEEMDRIQRIMDLKRLANDYEDAGLAKADAAIAAARDMREVQTALTAARAEEIDREEDRFDLQRAEMFNDHALVEQLQRKQELHERIQMWREKGVGLIEAERRATQDLAVLEAARLDMRKRAVAEAARDRDLTLANLRSESEATIRMIEKRNEIERRGAEIADRMGWNLDRGRSQAAIEVDEEERARLRGDFRTTFRDGVRAAMEGDLKDFVKNWWTDRLSKSLEDALNNVADLLFNLIKPGRGGAAGGGLLDGIGSVVGSLLGKSSPGFATGGSFEVGGRSGIDSNLVQFRATKGEIVNIRRPGQDKGGMRFEQHIHVAGGVDFATRSELQMWANAAKQGAVQAINESKRRAG